MTDTAPTPAEVCEQLGELLRSHRKTLGLSLREAAHEIGCNYLLVDRIEHGDDFTFSRFVLIARWLKLDCFS